MSIATLKPPRTQDLEHRTGGSMPTPARTSLEEILKAGRAIIETDGIAGLTMQAIADRVGVRAPSLYKRIRSRNQLLRLVANDAAAELTGDLDTGATTGDARRDLAARARTVRRRARRRPPPAWPPLPSLGRSATSPVAPPAPIPCCSRASRTMRAPTRNGAS